MKDADTDAPPAPVPGAGAAGAEAEVVTADASQSQTNFSVVWLALCANACAKSPKLQRIFTFTAAALTD